MRKLRPSRTESRSLLLSLALCSMLSGCLGRSEQLPVELLPETAFLIADRFVAVNFLPAGATKTSIPLTITAKLVGTIEPGSALESVSNWSMVCSGSGVFTTQNVSRSGSTLTILLSQSHAPASGESCTLIAAANGYGGDGNPSLLSACVTYRLDSAGPVVLAQSIASGASGVPVTSQIRFTFDESVDPASLSAANFQVLDHGTSAAVSGVISYNDSMHVATFTPASSLVAATQYDVVLVSGSSGIQDVLGNSMASNLIFSFSNAP